MRRQKLASNDIFSEITGHRPLIFGMKHCLVDFYKDFQLVAVGRNGPAGCYRFESNIYLKIFSTTAYLRCLKFVSSSA